MATILTEHAVLNGQWDVLLSVAGKPVTLSFPSRPTDEERDAAILVFEERMLAETEVGEEEQLDKESEEI